MDLDPKATADMDQLLAAVRDVPQEKLERFDRALADLALALHEHGAPAEMRRSFLYGCFAEAMAEINLA